MSRDFHENFNKFACELGQPTSKVCTERLQKGLGNLLVSFAGVAMLRSDLVLSIYAEGLSYSEMTHKMTWHLLSL